MNEFLVSSVYLGVLITLAAYFLGLFVKKKVKFPLANPILIAVILIIVFLKVFHIDYDTYSSGAHIISYLLTPTTICLAIPLYEQLEPLKKNAKAILLGIASGVLTSLVSIFVMALLFRLDHAGYVTLLPKSITTAIGIGVSEELGGYVSVTVSCIIITGTLGNIFAESICKLCHITEPVAKGIGIGTASHAIGTARAMEMGKVEGAMSSLSIVIAGLLTVVGAAVFSVLI